MATFLVALGGNALLRNGEEGKYEEILRNIKKALENLLWIVEDGHDLIITHGNGPMVGHALLRNESCKNAPRMPLNACVADTQGSLGHMISLTLKNLLEKRKIDRDVACMVTHVVVDKNDSSFSKPTKPIGSFYSEEEAIRLRKERKWVMEKDPSGKGYRRVVPSPMPIDIVEKNSIKNLIKNKTIVVASGGGGVPVVKGDALVGVQAVVDKDLASSILAKVVGANYFLILTNINNAYLNFKKENEKPIGKITLEEIEKYYKEGHFPPGSMGPKILAAMEFIRNGGEKVVICSLENAKEAFEEKTGTIIVKNQK